MKTSVLETIAEHWNRAGIHYAVAHGLEPYPDTVGRDLDILVPAAYIKMAIDIARNVLQTHGFTVIPCFRANKQVNGSSANYVET